MPEQSPILFKGIKQNLALNNKNSVPGIQSKITRHVAKKKTMTYNHKILLIQSEMTEMIKFAEKYTKVAVTNLMNMFSDVLKKEKKYEHN